jgi:hypothetical protein
MATYKLIQNVEAEDHILGPLSLRQFIFALISIFCFYICYILYFKHVAFLMVLFLPPALFFGFFAVPFGRDQPTEIWALAKIRYFLLPRKRIWNQSGVKQLVNITAPKKVEKILTNGLSQNEVQNRLNVLAQTLDSRGWAVKNYSVTDSTQTYVSPLVDNDSDRLVDVSTLPNVVSDDANTTDIMDENNSQISRQFDQMINQTTKAKHNQLIEQMNTSEQTTKPVSAQQKDQWFMPTKQQIQHTAAVTGAVPVAQQESAEEEILAESIKAQHESEQKLYNNLRTLQPISENPQINNPVSPPPSAYPSNPAIMSMVNNDDLSVSTIAHEVNKKRDDSSSDQEVVISLH